MGSLRSEGLLAGCNQQIDRCPTEFNPQYRPPAAPESPAGLAGRDIAVKAGGTSRARMIQTI
tara:strand:+ start:688 stop:873 length:186 start_codon:yes stop_codon:yes gene_type:complete